jgi:hypothetical protein
MLPARAAGRGARPQPTRPNGWPTAEAAADEEATLIARCDFAAARDKRLGYRNDVFGDRRAAFYE